MFKEKFFKFLNSIPKGSKVIPPQPPPKIDHEQSLKDAWRIINVLHMELMDHREAWPRALDWLSKHDEYR